MKKWFVKPLRQAILFFCAAVGIGWAMLWFDYQEKKSLYLQDSTLYRKTFLDCKIDDMSKMAQLIFESEIDKKPIKVLMAQAQQAYEAHDMQTFAKLHNQLYHMLKKSYNHLRHYNLRQLHFHLLQARSFVRFHRPNRFGDILSKVRHSVVVAQKEERHLFCFEEGRIYNGFRNLFPLKLGQKLVGSVEISFDARTVIEAFEKSLPLHALFMVKKKIVSRKVFKDEHHNYRPSLLLKDYMVDRLASSYALRSWAHTKMAFANIAPAIATELNKQPIQEGSYALYAQGKDWLITTLPIRNCQNKESALFLLLQQDPLLHQMRYSFYRMVGVALFFGLFGSILLYIYLVRKEGYEKRLSELSLIDPLTKIGNRRRFFQEVEAMVAHQRTTNKRLVMLFFDIDHFKSFNDQYGHEIGDRVLQSVAQTILHMIRKDDLFVRWGGEEFLVLLEGASLKEGVAIAQKMRHAVSQIHIQPSIPRITISIGVAVLEENESIEAWLKRADEALYRAKKEGRDRVVAAS